MDPNKAALIQTDAGVPPEVIQQIVQPVEHLLQESIDMDYQSERIIQLLRLERADAFDRGIQNIAPTMDDNGIVQLTAFGVTTGTANDGDLNDRALDYNPRKTRSYRDKFVAVLGQRPFYNVTAAPNDPTNENDRRGARQVNLLIQKFANEWPLRRINNTLFYYLFKHGTVLGRVRPLTDGERFGTTPIPNVVTEQQTLHPGGHLCINCGAVSEGTQPNDMPPCPGCGAHLGPEDYQPPITAPVAVQRGVSHYPNSSVELDLVNGYFFTVPFSAPDLTTPWLIVEADLHKGMILRAHPNAREIVGNTAGGLLSQNAAQTTGTTARMASQTQMGTVRAKRTNLWSYRQTWMDPAVYELTTDEQIRGTLQQYFPDGLRIVQVEDKVISLKNESLKTVFSYCQPAMSDYLFCEGTSWALHGMDDAYSNLYNIAQETLESGIARYLTNPDYIDDDAMNRLRYSPTRYIPALQKNGETLDNAFRIFPPGDYPQQLPEMLNLTDQNMQHICGVLEQLFGEMPPDLTLGQARMMLTQGLMQLGTVADNATFFYEQSFTNAVNLFCKTAAFNPQFQGEMIDLDLIRKSSWTIKGGTVMPRTFAERQTELLQMLTQNPQLADGLKILHPLNFGTLTDLFDLPDLKNPDMDAVEALKEIIDQLWQSQPIQQPPQPNPDGSGMGQPPPPQPSIDFDPLVYPPQLAAQIAQAALLDRNGQQRINTPGYANVRAFLQAAQNAIQPPPMPQPQLRLSLALDKTPTEQEMAVLQKFGITTPFPQNPSMDAVNKMDTQTHHHQLHGPKNAGPGQGPAQDQSAALANPLLGPGVPSLQSPQGQ